jgi:hypothetical protein
VTSVADDVRTRAAAANTKLQSNVVYHSGHNASKGQVTSVADDVLTRAAAANSKLQSTVHYKTAADVRSCFP